jgi:hypothetical protein
VTTLSGEKLSASAGAAVAERLTDLLNQCAPKAAQQPPLLQCGDVCVDSSDALEDCTLVRVAADARRNGQLLEIASTLSGLSITIREAELEQREGVSQWVFRVLSAKGTKLEYPEAASLLFLLGSATGDSRAARLAQTSIPL